MDMARRERALLVLISVAVLGPHLATAQGRFEVSFAPAAHRAPITGRVYIAITRTNDERITPIEQTGETGVPLFGVNVENLAAGARKAITGCSHS